MAFSGYLDLEDLEVVDRPLWWHKAGLSYTATGYGAKIPSARMVRYRGRLRRVYITCYSNAGTAWIIVGGERVVVR